MKWIATSLFIVIVLLAIFAKAPNANAGLKGGPITTPPVVTATPVSSRA